MWLRLLTKSLTPPGGMLIRTLSGHQDKINSVAITPDGRRAVSGSSDATIKTWALESGRMMGSIEGHMESVTAVAIAPNGRKVVSGSSDTTIRVWDLDSGRELRRWSGHSGLGWVLSLVITPDGSRIISGSVDGEIKLWDFQTGGELRTFRGHSAPVSALAVTPDGQKLVSTSGGEFGSDMEKFLKVWDLGSGREILSLSGHSESFNAVAVTPDGRYAITGAGSFLSGDAESTIKVWDLHDGSRLRVLRGHLAGVTALAITPDGRRMVSASYDTTLRLWDLATGAEVQTFKGHISPVYDVAITPNGRHMLSAGAHDATLKLWDIAGENNPTPAADHIEAVTALAVVPDGAHVVSASEDGTIKIWDVSRRLAIRTIDTREAVRAMALSPKSWGFAVTGHGNEESLGGGSARLWNLDRGVHDGYLRSDLPSPVNAIAFSSNARYLALGIGNPIFGALEGSMVIVWDRLNKSVTELAGHSNSVNAIVFTPDDQYLISATGDYIGAEGLIKVWDVETSAEMWSMRCPRGAIALAVHPDGRQIAYGANSSVSMLDLAAGGEVEPLLVSKGDEIFDSMTFTCSGKYFIATSRAKLRVWDTGTKDLVAEFTADNPFRSCAVAPDEVTIVAGDMKGLLHFLRLEQ